jgi:hypothetical protein
MLTATLHTGIRFFTMWVRSVGAQSLMRRVTPGSFSSVSRSHLWCSHSFTHELLPSFRTPPCLTQVSSDWTHTDTNEHECKASDPASCLFVSLRVHSWLKNSVFWFEAPTPWRMHLPSHSRGESCFFGARFRDSITNHTKMIAASRAPSALHAVIGLGLEPKRIRLNGRM